MTARVERFAKEFGLDGPHTERYPPDGPTYTYWDIKHHDLMRLLAEIERLRLRLWGNRQVKGHSHSTACSIWGEDGRGYVSDIPGSHPCNCGALLNFKDTEIQRLRKALEEIRDMKVGHEAEDVKYVQASQWHKMKTIATEALEADNGR